MSSFAGAPKVNFGKIQSKSFEVPAGTCGLKRFTHEWINTSLNDDSGIFRMNDAIFVVETTEPECIRDYAVVQFIRGCVYNVDYNMKTKSVDPYFGTVRDLRGKDGELFIHPTWAVDSIELDPLYAAYDATDRLGHYLIPTPALKLSNDMKGFNKDLTYFDSTWSKTYLKDYRLPTTIITTGDSPSIGGAIIDKSAGTIDIMNTSLEFQTCVYHTKDIPTVGDPKFPGTSESEGGPIVCFNWEDKNNFNPKTMKFDEHAFDGIDPFCSTKP